MTALLRVIKLFIMIRCYRCALLVLSKCLISSSGISIITVCWLNSFPCTFHTMGDIIIGVNLKPCYSTVQCIREVEQCGWRIAG